MKSTLHFLTRFIAFLLTFSSISAFAAAPTDASGSERLRIDFLAIPDWIEISHIEEIPERLTIRLVRKQGDAIPISTFNQDGPAFPELASIFKNKVDGSQVLFSIVKWRYYLSGVDTEGDYYEVHAYEAKKNGNGEIVFTENKKISNFYGSGFDGKQEGKIVKFRFKDASSIRKSLIQNNGNVKKASTP
ncbi:hypothetical protein [Paraburkholderia saeva]|uniref:hypothetical protein n=1 Tax=Paraburkholderia saeva TaxID=2777537 RepID=UPI001D635CE3|nr:hypothetical protein [Paraburkholderia saeva]CAG4923126.1 hypothetical protein R52603_05135 [Paraburkholderia saeva]